MTELLEKNVIVARSGVHKYLRREIPALKVGPIPEKYKDLKEFNVYRSAALIADAKDYYTRKPFIYTHKAYVNPDNFTDLVQGWTGDEATVEMNEAKTEAVVRTSLTIGGAEAITAFQRLGEKEVSPLHFGTYAWTEGVSPDGSPYQIEHISLSGVNHVALVPAGRGGHDAAILDHAAEDPMFLSTIWRFIKRLVGGSADELPETFRTKLSEIAKARATYTDESICEAAKKLWDCIADIPFTDDLALLQRYLGDIKGLARGNDKGQNDVTDAEAEKYVSLVSDLYEKLDTEALEEITKQESQMAKSADEMAKEEEEKKAAAAKDAMSKDADKEYDDLNKKIQEHRAAGGKASDWKMGGAKDEDESEAEKKREEEEKAKKEAAAKDAEAEETKKKEDEEKAKKAEEEKAKAADAAVADAAYGAPWSMRLGAMSQPGPDPALNLLGKMGFGPGKEKK